RQRVLSLASEAAGALGFEPHIFFDGSLDTVAEDRAVELLAVLREALTNVARHAGARRVDVEVVAEADLVLRVLDDGHGLGAERRAGAKGLANMEARAARLGGSVLVKPGPEGGTLVEWRVPLTSQ
ncbi:MAG: hypothetical protein Q8K72_15490, partial [Acidimicrobiales bacterium]|nr:hypothetical protein [Acidimicrobiales bacterium]